MKTIIALIAILLVAALVAGGFTLIVNNTSLTASGSDGESGRPAMTTNADGTTTLPTRPEGGNEGGLSAGGLLQVLVTFAKVTAISLGIVLIEKVLGLIRPRRKARAAV